MADQVITTVAQGLTVERVVFKALGRYVPGAVEATLDANRGLAGQPDALPSGTRILVPQPEPAQVGKAVEIIRLTD